MRKPFWRSSLKGRVATQHLVVGMIALAAGVGLLSTSTLFSRHAAAAPGQYLTPLTITAGAIFSRHTSSSIARKLTD